MYRPPSNPPSMRPIAGDSMNAPPRPASPGLTQQPPAHPVQGPGAGLSTPVQTVTPVTGPRPRPMQQPPPFRPGGVPQGPPRMPASNSGAPQPPASFGAPRPPNPPPAFGPSSQSRMQQQSPPFRPPEMHPALSPPGTSVPGTMQPPPPPSGLSALPGAPPPPVRPGALHHPFSAHRPSHNPATNVNGAPLPPPSGPGMPRPPFPVGQQPAPPGAHPMGAPPQPSMPDATGFHSAATTPPGPTPFGGRTSHDSSPKIDPSQMPRPASREPTSTPYKTRLNGHHQLPPLASENQICEDTGNCDPKFMRLSMNNVPSTAELCTNLALPMVAFMQPLALQNPNEEPVPVVDFGDAGPVRCGRCRAYMNPFMYFQDAGRSFVCVFCNVKNETPAEYFCYLRYDGKRRDADDRPELNRGTVEYVAPPSFMVRDPMPPVHFFLIDASYASASSGALHVICNSVKAVLDSIQGKDRALVGIATFGSSIEFYHVKNSDGAPQVLIVSDITEVFAPLPTLLMPLSENKDALLEILDIIPKLHENQTSGESCAGAAIEAAVEVLKPMGGKLHAILTTRPTKGTRALKPRDTMPQQTPDKAEREKQMILLPQDNTYRTLGLAASESSVCVDLFCLARNYIDVSTLSVLSHVTGGSVYHYDNFTVQHHGQQFLNDLRWNLTRPQGMEAVLRLRCSSGLEIENYLGSMNVRNQHEIELPALDCDKSIMAKILHDGKLQEGTEAYFQCALLYTTTSGHRRIRVCTMAVPVTAAPMTAFRGADLECYMNYLARKVAVSLPGNSLLQARNTITNGCINPLAAYRKYCATSTTSSGQLILPDALKLLPLYTLGLLKSTALKLDVQPDERSTFLTLLLSLPCSKILHLVYGRFFMLDPILSTDEMTIPESSYLSSEHLQESKLFLFENGHELLIKVESLVPSEMLEALFGFSQVNIKAPEPAVIVSEHPMNVRLHKLLNKLRMEAGAYMSLRVALRSTPLEARFLGHLVDDRNANGPSYVEQLCAIHRSIQNRLT